MFIATVDQRPIQDSEKMSHLKTLLTGKARSAISGMGYSGQFYGAAWSILEKKFGRPHVIIDAQLESLCKATQEKPHNSTGLISFSVIVSNFVIALNEYQQIGDKDEDWSDLIMFKKWLSRIAFVHEGFSVFKESQEKKSKETKIKTNGSQKHRTSVQVQT